MDLATIGQEVLRSENALLTPKDYEARLDKMGEAYPQRTRAELMQSESCFDFATSHYADALAQCIDAHVAEAFRAAFVK